MKVLVAYDGSKCADAALRDLRRVGLHRDADALVVTVEERWLPRPPQTVAPLRFGSATGTAPASEISAEVKRADEIALQAKSCIESCFTNWNVQSVTVSGSPAHEVLRIADDWKPDLIVVGCQGRTCVGGVFPGSVSQKILNEAHCSVRICKGTAWKNGSPIRLIVALDGSLSSEEAVKTVQRRAWPMWSEVRLVSVIDPYRSRKTGQSPGTSPAKISESIHEFVESVEAKLRPTGLRVSSRIEEGDPRQVIVIAAEEWGADCIFLGAASSSIYALGDVAIAVVARASCSVEVIRRQGATAKH